MKPAVHWIGNSERSDLERLVVLADSPQWIAVAPRCLRELASETAAKAHILPHDEAERAAGTALLEIENELQFGA
ncbi:MAG: hypothetical protein JST30_01500 [Armatimonadetes bacterium]|nr:hypothetical protein [Armatimonadota bacterium]